MLILNRFAVYEEATVVVEVEGVGVPVWGGSLGKWRVAGLKKKQVPQASRPGRDEFRSELQRRNDNSRALGWAGVEVGEMRIVRKRERWWRVVRAWGRAGRGSRCYL